MDSGVRLFHVQSAAGAALRGGTLGASLGLWIGLGELIASWALGESLLIPAPGRHPVPYVLLGAFAGAGLGILSVAVDVALRRLGRERPRAGLLVPIVTTGLTAGYGFAALTVGGAQWAGMPAILEALAYMLVLMGLGSFLISRDPMKTGWAGLPRGIELAAVAALSVLCVSLLVLRTGWLQSVMRPSGWSFLLMVAVFPLGAAAGRVVDTVLLRLLARLGRVALVVRPVLLLVVLLAVGGATVRRSGSPTGAAASEPRSGAPNVVLIVLDGARRDSVSALAKTHNPTPGFDAVAAAGAVFDHARTPSPWCLPGHLALFTGTGASRHGVTSEAVGEFREGRRSRASPRTIAERLAKAGYRTAGFSNNPWVGAITGLDVGFEDFYELSVEKYATMRLHHLAAEAMVDPWSEDDGAGRTARAAEAWIEKNKERPFFLFVNLAEPMPPWTPPLDPYISRALEALGIEQLRDAEAVRAVCRDPMAYWFGDLTLDWRDWDAVAAAYQAEVAAADEAVTVLWKAVERVGLRSRTLFVVTADHGQGMDFSSRMLANQPLLSEGVLRVPLAVSGPGIQAGRKVATSVSILDLLPTLLERIGLEADETLEGKSLSPLLAGEEPEGLSGRMLVSEYPTPRLHLNYVLRRKPDAELKHLDVDAHAAVVGNRKVWRDNIGRQAYYDLDFDPDEENPIREATEEWTRDLQKRLDAWIDAHPLPKKSLTKEASLAGVEVFVQLPFAWR